MKGIRLVLIVLILVGVGFALAERVRERDVHYKQFQLNLKPGDRVVVIRAGYEKVYVRVIPSEFKDFDLKVVEGKTLSGTLTLR